MWKKASTIKVFGDYEIVKICGIHEYHFDYQTKTLEVKGIREEKEVTTIIVLGKNHGFMAEE